MPANQNPALTPAEIEARLQHLQAQKAQIEAYEAYLKALAAQATPEPMEEPTTPTPTQLAQEWKALETVGDGSCGFNAIALGVGFYFADLRPVKPSESDADFEKKNAEFKQQDEAFKATLNNWLKDVKAQWDARNNPILKEFTKTDQEAMFNLIYNDFPGQPPADLIQYQKAMAPILRKYTAQALNQEVEAIFTFFNNQDDKLFFPIDTPTTNAKDPTVHTMDLKVFIPGKGLCPVESQENQQEFQAANNQASELGFLNTAFRHRGDYPSAPLIDENTTLENAKLEHRKYIAAYKSGLKAVELTNLHNASTWLSARGMVTCRHILHTPNVPFEINPVDKPQKLQLLQRNELRVVTAFPKRYMPGIIYIKKENEKLTYRVISPGKIPMEKVVNTSDMAPLTPTLLQDNHFKDSILQALMPDGAIKDYTLALLSDFPQNKVVHIEPKGTQLRCLYKKEDGTTIDTTLDHPFTETLSETDKASILSKLGLQDYGVCVLMHKIHVDKVVYLEKTDNQLRCIFKTPGKIVIEGELNIVMDGDLNTDKLNTHRAQILAQTSVRGHTVAASENSANPLNIHIKNLEHRHWELLKEEGACVAIQYPGNRRSNTNMPADTDDDTQNHPAHATHIEDTLSETQMYGIILLACVCIGLHLAWAPVVIGLLGVIGTGLVFHHTTESLYRHYCPNVMKTFANVFNFLRGNTPAPALSVAPQLETDTPAQGATVATVPVPTVQPEVTSDRSLSASPAK